MNKIFEYIILGTPQVGKTSIIIRYFDNLFSNTSYNTIGIDMRQKIFLDYGNYNVKMNIYDTAGQERYISIVTNFIKNKGCILLCFSLASLTSFEECKKYSTMINEMKDPSSIVILVGTFKDMKNSCKNINESDIDEFAKENNYKYYEVSAKTGEGIKELFESTLKIMIHNNLEKDENKNINLSLNYFTNPFTKDFTNPLKNKCC